MLRRRQRTENFKILEYTEMTIIQPLDEQHDFTMIFFAGFNENASKYLYLFKVFFEEYDYKIRIVIPNMPIVVVERGTQNSKKKTQSFFAWYEWSLTDGKLSINYNEEKDNFVINLIRKEIKKVKGNAEKIILAGFSMGGRYAMHILTKMKIKVGFTVIFKSVVALYENPYIHEKDPQSIAFMENQFHLYISIHDKIVNLPSSFRTIDTFKKCNFKFTIKVDNKKKHVLDQDCLVYLETLLYKYVFTHNRPRF
jgi:predicted esterase